MSFWDNVKKFTQPYADDGYDEDYPDEEYDDYGEEEAAEEAPRSGRRAPAYSSDEDAGLDFGMDFGSGSAAPAASSTAAPSGFNGSVIGMGSGKKQEVVLFHAKVFGDSVKAADDLRSRKAVILNMENVDKALTRRIVDFLTGCVYALDGQVKKIAQSTYLFCPAGIDIVGELEAFKGEAESYI